MKSAPLQHKPSTWRLMLAPCIQMWSQGVLNKYLLAVRFTYENPSVSLHQSQRTRCLWDSSDFDKTLRKHRDSEQVNKKITRPFKVYERLFTASLSLFISQPSSVNQRGGLGVCGEIMFKQRITLKLTPDASLCVRVWVQAHVTLLSI